MLSTAAVMFDSLMSKAQKFMNANDLDNPKLAKKTDVLGNQPKECLLGNQECECYWQPKEPKCGRPKHTAANKTNVSELEIRTRRARRTEFGRKRMKKIRRRDDEDKGGMTKEEDKRGHKTRRRKEEEK